MQIPAWQLVIDWDSDGGLLLGDFEFSTQGWTAQAFGVTTQPAVVAQSTARAYHGDTSLLVTWGGGVGELAQALPVTNLIIGRSYTASAWVYVPSPGGRHLVAAIAGLAFGTTSAVTNTWVEVSITWTATAATHQFQLWTSGTATAGEQTWIDFVRVLGAGEEVFGAQRVLWDSTISVDAGRDKARALAPSAPATGGFVLDNQSLDYSPENGSSPLNGLLGPGRAAALHATYGGKAYTLLRQQLDGFDLGPDPGTWAATFGTIDSLARLKDLHVSTALYSAVRTGQAVHYLLDAIGWTGPRDIDAGGSTLLWWWLESDDAYADLQDILAAEGPGALAYIGPSGEFAFRDRHHRLIRSRSTSSQGTFRDSGNTEPLIEEGVSYDYGWREVVNSVELAVTERAPAVFPTTVWQDDTFFTVAPGASVVIPVEFDDPVYGVISPTQGTVPVNDPDILRTTSTVVTAVLSRTSGQSLTLTLSVAVGAGAAAQIRQVRLRGQPVTTARTLKVQRQDTEAIRRAGGSRPYRLSTKWLNRYDAEAIADIVLGQRANPLTTVTFEINNTNATTIAQQLQRRVSDRIHATLTRLGLDADFYIEQIGHRVSQGGNAFSTRFGCEKIPALPGNVFRFDTVGAGFDQGVFAPSGLDDPARVFLFNTAGHGFDDGVFAT